MKVNLSQPQRILVSLIYLVILTLIFKVLGGSLDALVFKVATDRSIWFYSGALLIVLGKYVAEPYFTKPTDSLANSLALIIALISLNDKYSLFGYTTILTIALSVLILTLVSIALKNSENPFYKWMSASSYWYVINIGSSQVLFSMIFLSSIYSYLALASPQDLTGFIVLIAFWICLVFFDVVGLMVQFISKFGKVREGLNLSLGKAIGCENPLLYKVEINNSGTGNVVVGRLVSIENTQGSRSIGLIINVRQLLSKKWISVYLFTDADGYQLKMASPSTFFRKSNSMFNQENEAFFTNTVNELPKNVRDAVTENELYKNRNRFIGYVDRGTNLNSLKFHVLNKTKSNEVAEGSILSTKINGKSTLYQVIDGLTIEESLENQDLYGFVTGVARKLGFYDGSKMELDVVSWLPEMYTPIYNHVEAELSDEDLRELASQAIGRLPGSNYAIPIKNINELVTHNTAILGILGIGKSCLTFELIQKAKREIDNLKIICIDITNEYGSISKLPSYVEDLEIQSDEPTSFNDINGHYDYVHVENNKQNHELSGNQSRYREAIKSDLINFIFDEDSIPEAYTPSGSKRIRLYNPDYHKVSRGEKIGFNVITTALSPAEKTRIIAEETLKILMKFSPTGGSQARILLVFEEAHSLVPEWNSVSNDGDKTAVNGTAKVILQGRKYGLGSLVITQRTANISKSILNQCNTIFALRVFDDTGKQFLENYIGSDYANTLPTLEERHAIVVGKALKLKQPVIIQLNDMKYLRRTEE